MKTDEEEKVVSGPVVDLNELFRDTWFYDELQTKIPDVDPGTPPHPGEQVIGDMNALERKIYSHRAHLTMMGKMLQAKMEMSPGDEKLFNAVNALVERGKIFDVLLWSLLHERFNASNIGVRTKFKIIDIQRGQGKSIQDIIELIT